MTLETDMTTEIDIPDRESLMGLYAATTALAQARTLDDVKPIIDLAAGARAYAKAAKLGLAAANYAVEIKLRAERKAGELLAELERGHGNRFTVEHSSLESSTNPSEYRAVLAENDIAPTTAHRWQTVASVPEELFEEYIATVKANQQELITAGVMKLAAEVKEAAAGTMLTAKWTESEMTRREEVEQGITVIANMKTDLALIAWAKEHGLFARIDRETEWGNPFYIGKDGTREECILKYEDYYFMKPSLWAQLANLRGKVLGCWCYPEDCHGLILINFLAVPTDEPFSVLAFGYPIGGPEDYERFGRMKEYWAPLRYLEEHG